MANDESNFDTMRLIAGADSTDLYSLEEILQEFSEEDGEKSSKAQKQETASPQGAGDAVSEKARPEGATEPSGADAPEMTEMEAFHTQSEAEMADAIAQAIAASIQPEEPLPVQEPAVEATPPETEEAPRTAADPETAGELSKPTAEPDQTAKSAAEPRKKSAPTQKRQNPAQPAKRSEAKTPEAAPPPAKTTAREEAQKPIPNVKTSGNAAAQTENVKNPGTQHKKIPKSHVSVGVLELAGMMLGDLRTRQRAALPSHKTSLKAAEKSNALLVRISGAVSPLRYIILLLMAFSLAGRRFSWMQLGFLGGATGVTIALILTLVAVVAAWQSVLRAVRDVVYLRFSYESLLLLTTVLSLLDTAVHKNENTLLPLLAIAWCLSGTAALMTTRANLRSLRTVITGRTRKGVRVAADKWEHTDCIGKASASTSGFVRHQEETDTWHSGWSAYSLLLLIAALIVSAYLSAKTEGNYLTILVTLLTVSLPVSLSMCCARPYELLTRVLNGAGAVAGWFGVKALSGKKAVLIYDEDLFPKGTIGHKGVKVYGKQTPRLLVSYAASLMLRADNGLGEVFTRLLKETDGKIYEVNYFQAMEAGLAGRINGVLVAVGTYNFMQLLGAMPPANGPKNGIYISLNGEVAGVFAVKYVVRSGAADGFERIVRDRGLTALVVTKNFCVNPSFVENWFHAPVSEIVCPKLETRRRLSEPLLLVRGTTCGYVLKDGIAPYSRLVAGARRVYRTGLIFTVVSVVFSLLMLIRCALTLSTGGTATGGALLLLYQMILFVVLEAGARIAVR